MRRAILPSFQAANPQSDRKAKPPRNMKRVKGFSAACKKKKHSKCYSVSCSCIHHYNENRREE